MASDVEYILETLGYDSHIVELGKIAAYLHDIGNLVNRTDHSQSGAIMAFRILDYLEMEPSDIADVATALGNHDEGSGTPVSPISVALILADKADVRRSRTRNRDTMHFDIHDRVNYSVKKSQLKINSGHTIIKLKLEIDTKISPVMDFLKFSQTAWSCAERPRKCWV